VVEHTVTIEKDSRATPLERNFALGAGKCVGHADVDEVALEGHR